MLGSQSLASSMATNDDGSTDLVPATHVEKLLKAIDRLRSERDELRTHLDFAQAESRFTIESLQAQLAQSPSLNRSSRETPAEEQLQVATRLRAYSNNVAMALAVVVQQIDAQHAHGLLINERQSKDLDELRAQLHQAQFALERGMQESVRGVRAELDAALTNLSAAESQTAGFKSTVEHLEDDITRERLVREEIGESLVAAHAHITELTKAVANAEAARDAVALERTHLEQDLDKVRRELAEADERYSKQLSALTSHDSTRALRTQITTLEQRVMRRTEQVGVHQHDIKRLETNLRLQEERIAEMSAELEVAHAERAAMVEDCKTTREERDEALKRCEEAEEMTETLEEARDAEVTTMVGIVFAALAKQKASVQKLRTLTTAHHTSTSHSAVSIASLEAANGRLSEEITLSRQECYRLNQALEEKINILQTMEEERSRASTDADASARALDAIQRELRESVSSATAAEEGKLALQALLDSAQQKLQEKLAELASAHEELTTLRGHLSLAEDEATVAASEKSQLEETVRELEEARDRVDKLYQETLAKLAASSDELQRHLLSTSERSQVAEQQRSELDRLRTQYSEEASQFEAEVERLTSELKEAQDLHAAAYKSHEETVQGLIQSNADLEQQLADVKEAMQAGARLDEEVEQVKSRYEEQLRDMEEKLTEAASALEEAVRKHDEAQAESQAAVDELTKQLTETSEQLGQKSSLEFELSQLRAEHADQVQSLQAEIEATRMESQDAASKQLEIDALKSQLELTKAQLQEASDSETKLLQSRLEAVEAQLAEVETAKVELQRTTASEVEATKAQLETTQAELRKLEESKAELDAQLQSLSGDRSRTVAELQDRLDVVAEECSQLKTKLQDEVDQQKREQEEHRSELQKAVETLRQSEVVREKALRELEEVSLKLEEAESSIKTLREEKTSTQFEVTNLEAEIQRSKSVQRFQESKIQER